MQETDEIPEWMGRTQLLLGNEALHKLRAAKVMVVGLGGVGGIAAEMIARAGVGHLTIIDADVVEASNRNRQVIALASTNQLQKATVLADRLRDINPEIDLQVINDFVLRSNMGTWLSSQKFDYVADCFDTLTPKVMFIKYCWENKIPLVSSMGAGGRLDPSQVKISDISKTFNCYLAYYVRKKLHKHGIYKGVTTVSSEELPAKRGIEIQHGRNKKSVIGTMSYMPNIFGCLIASVVIRVILKK